MNMKKSRCRIIGLGCTCLMLIAVVYLVYTGYENPYRLEVIQFDNSGYGYKIREGKRTIIVQPFIPVIAGKKGFKTEQEAQRVGQLVLKRITAGENFSITRKDLERLNVCLSD